MTGKDMTFSILDVCTALLFGLVVKSKKEGKSNYSYIDGDTTINYKRIFEETYYFSRFSGNMFI